MKINKCILISDWLIARESTLRLFYHFSQMWRRSGSSVQEKGAVAHPRECPGYLYRGRYPIKKKIVLKGNYRGWRRHQNKEFLGSWPWTSACRCMPLRSGRIACVYRSRFRQVYQTRHQSMIFTETVLYTWPSLDRAQNCRGTPEPSETSHRGECTLGCNQLSFSTAHIDWLRLGHDSAQRIQTGWD